MTTLRLTRRSSQSAGMALISAILLFGTAPLRSQTISLASPVNGQTYSSNIPISVSYTYSGYLSWIWGDNPIYQYFNITPTAANFSSPDMPSSSGSGTWGGTLTLNPGVYNFNVSLYQPIYTDAGEIYEYQAKSQSLTFTVTGSPTIQLVDQNRGNQIQRGDSAWILPGDGTLNNPPTMPQLEAQLLYAPPDAKVRWKFDVSYVRPNGHRVPSDQIHLEGSGTDWKIYEVHTPTFGPVRAQFFGGNASLTCSVSGQDDQNLEFVISGSNPDETACRSYIDSVAQNVSHYVMPSIRNIVDPAWYAYAIAKVESEYIGSEEIYNQFFTDDQTYQYSDEFGSYWLSFDAGTPVFGNDGRKNAKSLLVGGFGLFQITGIDGSGAGDIPTNQLWNWEDNVKEAIQKVIGAKINRAYSYLKEQKLRSAKPAVPIPQLSMPRADLDANGNIPPDDQILVGGDAANGGVPPTATVTFLDGTPSTFLDAETIKRFNSGSFCVWDKTDKQWEFDRTRGFDQKSYVDLVTRQIKENRVHPLPTP